MILITHREIIGRRENAEKGPPEVSAIPPKNERRAESPPKNSIPHPLCLQALQVADAKKKWLHAVEEGKKKKKKKANPISPHHTARYSHLSQAPQQFLLHHIFTTGKSKYPDGFGLFFTVIEKTVRVNSIFLTVIVKHTGKMNNHQGNLY